MVSSEMSCVYLKDYKQGSEIISPQDMQEKLIYLTIILSISLKASRCLSPAFKITTAVK